MHCNDILIPLHNSYPGKVQSGEKLHVHGMSGAKLSLSHCRHKHILCGTDNIKQKTKICVHINLLTVHRRFRPPLLFFSGIDTPFSPDIFPP